jgi:long-chain fatty acid transport protein
MSKFQKTTLATALLLVTAQSSAAGFQVSEHSASGLGRAFAGEAAVADNASVLARNPAAMSRFKQAEFTIVGSYVAPDVNIEGVSDTRLDADNIVNSAFVPATYFIQPINDKFAVGVGLFSTYGVATEFEKDYAAGTGAGTTDLMTFNINPSVSFKATEQLSLGLGLNATYGTATVDRYLGDLGGSKPETSYFAMEGDTWGFGWNAGVLFEFNETNRIGLAYRSQVDMDFEGEYKGLNTLTKTVDAGLDLPLPATAEFSGYNALTESFAVTYSVLWTQWSKFTELKAVKSDDGRVLFDKPEEFDDNIRYSIGAEYEIDQLVLRAGFAYDESAGKTTLSIPESDRFWYTAGATYNMSPALSLDFGLAYIYSSDVEFKEDAGGTIYNLKSSGDAIIASAQANYRF